MCSSPLQWWHCQGRTEHAHRHASVPDESDRWSSCIVPTCNEELTHGNFQSALSFINNTHWKLKIFLGDQLTSIEVVRNKRYQLTTHLEESQGFGEGNDNVGAFLGGNPIRWWSISGAEINSCTALAHEVNNQIGVVCLCLRNYLISTQSIYSF